MGRKKIEIKLIRNERLRNVLQETTQITYNKRKRGLLKKLVELSVMCGIKAKLEIKDKSGNLIVLNAGERAPVVQESPKDKVFVFSPADVHGRLIQYPDFRGFENIRPRNRTSQPEDEVPEASKSEDMPFERKEIPEQGKAALVRNHFESQQNRATFAGHHHHPPAEPAYPTDNSFCQGYAYNHMMGRVPTVPDQPPSAQSMQLYLQYAQLRYQSMMHSYMNMGRF